jgi:GT2 family glycosyltransferase
MNTFPTIGIVIVHLNAYHDTSACLRSLQNISYPNVKVIVVDNGSVDASGARLRMEFPEMIHLRSNENLGFSGGNNLGIRYALEHGCEHILLLNSDTVITKSFLEPLVERLLSDPKIGAVGGKIYYYPPAFGGHDKIIWYAGSFQKWHTGFHHYGESEKDRGQYDTAAQTEYVCGCLMLMRGDVIWEIGGLSNEYFVYWEESDWCLRARELGYSCWYEPRSVIYHNFKSAVKGEETALYSYMQTRNSFIFAKHHFHGFLLLRHLFFYPIYLFYRWLSMERKRNTAGAKALVRGIIDYFKGYRGNAKLREYGYIRS